MKKLFITLIFLVFLVSCTKKERTIIVNTQNADGLTTKTKLDVNGLEIGQVVEMNLTENGTINLICKITNEIEIPIDSKFYTKDLGLLGGKGIGIVLGTQNENIEAGGTVKMVVEKSEKISNPFTKKFNEIMEKFNTPEQRDSLHLELKKLNKDSLAWELNRQVKNLEKLINFLPQKNN